MDRLLGLITGVAFGFLLQKGRVLRYEKQVGAMLLRDMTILKFMLSAILVGMVGLHILQPLELVSFSIKGSAVVAVLGGGLLFGAGWAVMGYCPGTSLGALGEGRWHAIWAMLGMVVGAALFAEAYPWLERTVYTWLDLGKITLPGVLRVNAWFVIVPFTAIVLALFRLFERKGV